MGFKISKRLMEEPSESHSIPDDHVDAIIPIMHARKRKRNPTSITQEEPTEKRPKFGPLAPNSAEKTSSNECIPLNANFYQYLTSTYNFLCATDEEVNQPETTKFN